MKVTEVAALLRVTRRTVWQWCQKGLLHKIKIGPQTVRFARAEVEALATAQPAGVA